MVSLSIRPGSLKKCETIRSEVRAFLAEVLRERTPLQRAESWMGYDVTFSRLLGERGWIGMTWPREYGGGGFSDLERYTVIEELLAAGAPVAAHWFADRQSGPLLLRYGSEEQRRQLLPKIARGELFFCIGLSEPGSGSDLASVRTRAERSDAGWCINGQKVWTTNAHRSHYMVALVRTGAAEGGKEALSQFLIDIATPGITVRPVRSMDGEHHFNEVFFENVRLPFESLIGREGQGWEQVTAELSLERSGPERYLSSIQLVVEMLNAADAANALHTAKLGRMVAEMATLRQMSIGVAGLLAAKKDASLGAVLVKDGGANMEQDVPEIAHALFGGEVREGHDDLEGVMAATVLAAPSFSLRGGTREILRGIIARVWVCDDLS